MAVPDKWDKGARQRLTNPDATNVVPEGVTSKQIANGPILVFQHDSRRMYEGLRQQNFKNIDLSVRPSSLSWNLLSTSSAPCGGMFLGLKMIFICGYTEIANRE
jgi:hypothetical protein